MTWFAFVLGVALAQESIKLEVVHTVHAPGKPELVLLPQMDATHIAVELQCGTTDVSHTGAANSGSTIRIPIPVDVGTHQCSGTLVGMFRDGTQGEMPLQFSVAVQRSIILTATANDVDLEKRTLHVQIDQPAQTLELHVYGETGHRIGVDVIRTVATSPVKLSWPPHEGTVMRLAIKATTASGLGATLDLFPWSYQIPHQDVVFSTGSATVPQTEYSKLDAVMADIQNVLQRFDKTALGFEVPMALYVAGFTDTVGNRISNQRLSEARAKELGRWFQRNGFSRPIHYQGLGENGLAVQTADEVEHPANRRAVYIIAADTPKETALLPTSNWRALR